MELKVAENVAEQLLDFVCVVSLLIAVNAVAKYK